jgi:ABC-type iron transport system FetAB permease component
LWLVFRKERHPIGMCLGATERRAIAPQIQHALQSQRI